jgi:DNA-directed RNA polymerase sigma subunit (sigma70/sigma32)
MQGRAHGVDLDAYLAGYPREKLSRDEEQRIGALPFEDADRWKLVNHNMRFAVRWCFQLYNRNHLVNDFESLLGVAQDAMIDVALRRFEARGTPFVSYAAHYLRRDTNHEVHRQLCVVKLPDLRKENKDRLREDTRYQTPLDACDEHALGTDDGGVAETEHLELRSHLISEIERLIEKPEERKIMHMYYGLDGSPPMSSTEILTQLGKFSRAGIRKVLLRGKKRLARSRVLKELAEN